MHFFCESILDGKDIRKYVENKKLPSDHPINKEKIIIKADFYDAESSNYNQLLSPNLY